MKIFIDYNCNILYASLYIEHLRNNFEISFEKAPFDLLPQKENLLLFSVVGSNKLFNFVIDFADSSAINELAYEWCDAYGKVNYNLISGNYFDIIKIVKISPSFGVKIWGKYTAIFYTILHYLKFYPASDFRRLLSNYISQKNRLMISEYRNHTSDSKYIFFASTLWNKQNHNSEEVETNNYRGNFIRACRKNANIKFEGGFAPNSEMGIYEGLFMRNRVSIKEYVEKISRSACAFNTPAVFSCHGWKLGEYLALGKAIISTPIKNELPTPLEHGVNIHIVTGDETEINEAIKKIFSEDNYRKKLESGAYQYWLDYGLPKNAINDLFKKVNLNMLK